MKKMEFMRAAAKILMEFFAELYVEQACTLQTISLKTQQGSFKLRNSGTLAFYVYKTGTVSYNTASVFKDKTEYHEYYVYAPEDDHEQVLEKFAQDLRKLAYYFDCLFLLASDSDDPFKLTVFKYDEPFSTQLYKNGSDTEDM